MLHFLSGQTLPVSQFAPATDWSWSPTSFALPWPYPITFCTAPPHCYSSDCSAAPIYVPSKFHWIPFEATTIHYSNFQSFNFWRYFPSWFAPIPTSIRYFEFRVSLIHLFLWLIELIFMQFRLKHPSTSPLISLSSVIRLMILAFWVFLRSNISTSLFHSILNLNSKFLLILSSITTAFCPYFHHFEPWSRLALLLFFSRWLEATLQACLFLVLLLHHLLLRSPPSISLRALPFIQFCLSVHELYLNVPSRSWTVSSQFSWASLQVASSRWSMFVILCLVAQI